MKLKTLKDFLDFSNENVTKEVGEDRIKTIESLRAEAVKWIKEIENKDSLMHGWKEMGCLPWIVHFFGITEEDLK